MPFSRPSPSADFTALFRAMPGNCLLLTPDFVIADSNDAYLAATLTRREDIVGRGLFEVFPDNPDDPTADGVRNLRASLERVRRENRRDPMELQRYDIPLPDNKGFEERYWSPVNTPVRGIDGSVAWIIHAVEDVTGQVRQKKALEEQTAGRLQAEQALRQAQKMEAIGQLTGGIAHDFNNLLTVVGGSLDLIRRAPDDPTRVGRLAESALVAVDRCSRLIKQLLMFARRQIMHPETVNPNQLIIDFQELMDRATDENVELVTKLDPALYPTRIDPAQFEGAILNLVVNAKEAIGASGKIVIETRNEIVRADQPREQDIAPGSYVMVAVSDNGHGIPRELLSRVFDPFVTTKEVGKGSGLGLSQVYGFAKESGGHVRIYSEVGVGTTVRLYLPRSVDFPMEAERQDEVVPLRRTLSGETVLVVEDDEPVLDMAVESLKELGYRVLTAPNAIEALEIVKSDQPIDVLFSDVVMPGGMNGVQLAVEARRLRPALKILLTSGYTASALATQHGLQDNVPLLEKPYRPQELADRFRKILRAV